MKNILVTGANGLLGTNTVHALIAAGYNVVAMLRNINSYKGVRSDSLVFVEGDITSMTDVINAASGCDAIIHCAAYTAQCGKEEAYYRVNTEGSINVFEAAARLNIRRVVNIATANIFAFGSMEYPGNESEASVPPFSLSPYVRSKAAARNAAKEYSDELDIITLCPTFMLGPYDSKPSSGRIILMGYKKPLRLYPPGGKNFVSVQDVAACAVSALTRGTPGRSYLVCGENLSYKEFFLLLSDRADSECLMIKVPGFILKGIGFFGSMLQNTFGIHNEFNSENMEMLCTGNYYGSDRAAKELGFSCRKTADAIDEAIGWFKVSGMI